MTGISIKKNRLYFYIRRFNERNESLDDYHVDDLSFRRVPRRYWYKLAFEAFDLSKRYISKKDFHMFCCLQFCVKISDVNNVCSIKDLRYTSELFSIYFFKEYDYPRDFFLGMTYSEKLSEIFSMDVYLWWYEGRWCLYLLEKDRKI